MSFSLTGSCSMCLLSHFLVIWYQQVWFEIRASHHFLRWQVMLAGGLTNFQECYLLKTCDCTWALEMNSISFALKLYYHPWLLHWPSQGFCVHFKFCLYLCCQWYLSSEKFALGCLLIHCFWLSFPASAGCYRLALSAYLSIGFF